MKLKVTMFAENEHDFQEHAPGLIDIDFDKVVNYETKDDFFIVNKEDGTFDAIRKYKILKFSSSI